LRLSRTHFRGVAVPEGKTNFRNLPIKAGSFLNHQPITTIINKPIPITRNIVNLDQAILFTGHPLFSEDSITKLGNFISVRFIREQKKRLWRSFTGFPPLLSREYRSFRKRSGHHHYLRGHRPTL